MKISSYISQKHKDQHNNWQETLEGVWRSGNPSSLSVELKADTDSIDIKARNSQKAENKSILGPVYTTPCHILKGFNIICNRFLIIYVDFYSIYNSQEMKTTQTPYRQQLHNENTVDIHYGLLSIFKEKNYKPCRKMNGARKDHIAWGNSEKQRSNTLCHQRLLQSSLQMWVHILE